MVPLSSLQAVGLALIPGNLEEIRDYAYNSGNMGLHGLASRMQHSRNALYFGVALTIIGGVGAILSNEENRSRQYTCAMLASFGLCISVLATKKLYQDTLMLL